MIIDCQTCVAPKSACADCVVSVVLGPVDVALGAEDRRVIGLLSASGLVPPLRAVASSSTGTEAEESGKMAG